MSASDTPKWNLCNCPNCCTDNCPAGVELADANAKLAEYASVEVPEEPPTCGFPLMIKREYYAPLLRAYRAQAVRLRGADRDAAALWKLLDDIDTASDRYKSNYKELAEYVYKTQRKRFEIMTGEQFDAAIRALEYPK